MDKKRLYESIMMRVSQQVKKTLNEYTTNNLKSIFVGDTQNSDVSINWHNKKTTTDVNVWMPFNFSKKRKNTQPAYIIDNKVGSTIHAKYYKAETCQGPNNTIGIYASEYCSTMFCYDISQLNGKIVNVEDDIILVADEQLAIIIVDELNRIKPAEDIDYGKMALDNLKIKY